MNFLEFIFKNLEIYFDDTLSLIEKQTINSFNILI
jgi:hypothetical protein